jgi:hypothetical protein
MQEYPAVRPGAADVPVRTDPALVDAAILQIYTAQTVIGARTMAVDATSLEIDTASILVPTRSMQVDPAAARCYPSQVLVGAAALVKEDFAHMETYSCTACRLARRLASSACKSR